MRRALFMVGWMLTGTALHAADDIEPLDADFLEYLANMEDEQDNWTLIEGAHDKSKPASGAEQSASKIEPRKASKEAAKPAVEER
jgi:metallophosphoesterase superfamily enzyme